MDHKINSIVMCDSMEHERTLCRIVYVGRFYYEGQSPFCDHVMIFNDDHILQMTTKEKLQAVELRILGEL